MNSLLYHVIQHWHVKFQQPTAAFPLYLRSSSSMTSAPKTLVSVIQEVRLYDLQLSFLPLIVCDEIFFTWTLSSCKCLHQLAKLPHNHSPFPQVTVAARLPRCCPEMIRRISFILTAQLFVILSRSSKAINCTEEELLKHTKQQIILCSGY